MKIRQFMRKLFLPLYLSFLFSLLMGAMLSGFFEHFSNMPFEDLAQFVKENSDKIQAFFSEEHIEGPSSREMNQTGQTLENQFLDQFGSEDDKTVDEKLEEQYLLYRTRHPVGILLLLMLIWLWPVYKYNFKGKGEADERIIRRILNLPTFLFIIPWIAGLWGLILKLGFRSLAGYPLNGQITANYIASFIMYGSLAGFINSWYTTRYINNGIARQIFRNHQLHTLKNGITMNLTTRMLLLMLSMGMIPLILSVYIPAVFNSWMFRSIFLQEDVNLLAVGQILGPLMITTIVNLFFLVAQLSSIFSFRRNIQGPINILIERMQMVAKGDFSIRTSVLSSDEIGNLKGHFNTMVEGLEEREKLRNIFGKFVSIEIARKLIDTNEIDLSGEEIETTVMFADIRSFTSLSEGYTPRELIDF
ncbi:MAG: HAMP domain-containing protein [Spirochaetales bacterium]|nr:HAMP domain-containing protein [Spirochaetales bacterium]